MKVLVVGSGIGDHFWGLHVERLTRALRHLGHDVEPRSYTQIIKESKSHRKPTIKSSYDLLVLQDTHLPGHLASELARRSQKVALFTHSEFIQGKRDIPYIKKVWPDHIFTDQPDGPDVFSDLSIPCTWMGHGADLICEPATIKDIDVLWVGNKYAERHYAVQNSVLFIRESEPRFSVKVHGAGYPDGPVKPSGRFELMGRARIVVHICGVAATKGGYGGSRISDSLASGAYVVSTDWPGCREHYPHGVSFCKYGELRQTILDALHDDELDIKARMGYNWVKANRMAINDIEKMMEALGI